MALHPHKGIVKKRLVAKAKRKRTSHKSSHGSTYGGGRKKKVQ